MAAENEAIRYITQMTKAVFLFRGKMVSLDRFVYRMNCAGTLRLSNRKTVNIMKKSIALLLALTMLLCLALTGCGQNTDTQEANSGSNAEQSATADNDSSNEDFNTGDSTIMDGTNNPGDDFPLGNDESIPDGGAEWEATHGGGSSGGIDNTNPKQDASGMYVYTVQGHEIKLRVNIWDYIGWIKVNGVQIDDVFKVDKLAEYYGYDEKYNSDGAYKHVNSDGTMIYAGFEYGGTPSVTHIVGAYGTADKKTLFGSGAVHIYPYDLDLMDYSYSIERPISMDMIILCAYAMEYYADGNQGNCFEEIFGERAPNLSPYEAQQ